MFILKYRVAFLSLIVIVVLRVSVIAVADINMDNGNLFSFERLGAGVPAGWRVDGDGFRWEAEMQPGPLGPGAARIRFEGKGQVSLESPGRFMCSGVNHAVSVWLRSDPPGARIQLRIADNDREETLGLDQTAIATADWQRVVFQTVLPKAIKDRYFLSLHANGENCILWLDGLWLGECKDPPAADWPPDVHPAGVVLEPEAPWGLVTGDAPLRVRAKAVGVTQPGCCLALHAVHTNGNTSDLPALPIDDRGIWEGRFEVDHAIARPFGMLRVEAAVLAPDGTPRSAKNETLLARAPEPAPGPRPDSPFGVHVALREPDLSAVAKLGYKWCRIHDASNITKWGYIEPERGQWIWHDDQVALARRAGLCILGMLDTAPAWSSGAEEGGYFRVCHAPGNIGDWRNYVRQVVSHYAGSIDDWEVWNEPWDMFRFFQGGNPMLYRVLLQAAYEEAKSVNPNCTVVGVDTYPPVWDTVVLGCGALPYYDVMSWHRYDSNLPGRPNDSIARVAQRLHDVQAGYGTPKPLLCSEGGPDVTLFHGSFFSFADPVIMGDWSRGADLYSRWFLSAIAAGNQRFIAYSVHNDPRHGWPTHMLIEPEYLLRPLHLSLAALAYFVEGAKYETRLIPAPDISAHIFRQSESRPYADAPSVVVALIADGEEPEDLTTPIPEGVACYDRFANPAVLPVQATRGITYLVARGDAGEQLLAALRGAPSAETGPDTLEALTDAAIAALTKADPLFWTQWSAQGSLLLFHAPEGPVIATRAMLKSDAPLRERFRLPESTRITGRNITPAGPFTMGVLDLADASTPPQRWSAAFSAVPDGPGGAWRLISLTVLPIEQEPSAEDRDSIEAGLRLWERALIDAHTRNLHDSFYDGPCCVAAATRNGEYFVFSEPEYLLTMLNTAVLWGPAKESAMEITTVRVHGDIAFAAGRWNISSLAFGTAPYAITASFIRSGAEWKIASMCAGAP